MVMGIKIQLLRPELKQGQGKASGKPYAFWVSPAVVTLNDGTMDVGELVLFDQIGEIKAGVYEPEFSVQRDREGRLSGRIVKLNALARSA
jgi:hypothetical protein